MLCKNLLILKVAFFFRLLDKSSTSYLRLKDHKEDYIAKKLQNLSKLGGKLEKSKKISIKNTLNPLKYFLTCYRIKMPKKGNNKQKCKKHTIDIVCLKEEFFMSVKVAINGFGRIGRLAFRQMFGAEGYEIVAINDLTSPSMLAHLLKYDSAQGKYEKADTVVAGEDSITVDGKTIKIYAKADANELPWGEIGVDVVLECTGFYTSKDKAMAHINAGAKRVVISAPAGKDLPTVVYNVNQDILTPEDKIISAASCTTNCLAPMAKALNDYVPIQSGIMSTIHAYTGDQMLLDGPHRKGNLRRARAAAVNIVPNSTGAAKAIGLVIPELNGKLIGSAQRVPVPTGSTTILVAVVKGKDITVESINSAMKAASNESFGYTEEELVSSDVIGMRYGSLFDSTQTMVQKIDDDTYQVQVVSWYDNENSYTSQMVRTIKYFAELEK
mgnify:CR=1 FL=1